MFICFLRSHKNDQVKQCMFACLKFAYLSCLCLNLSKDRLSNAEQDLTFMAALFSLVEWHMWKQRQTKYLDSDKDATVCAADILLLYLNPIVLNWLKFVEVKSNESTNEEIHVIFNIIQFHLLQCLSTGGVEEVTFVLLLPPIDWTLKR